MSWDSLPIDIIKYIFYLRKYYSLANYATQKIENAYYNYKLKKLINIYKELKYLKEFRKWNPNIQEFLLRSRL